MARVETIVVGGGVAALAPFTVNRIPYISLTDPATIGATTVAGYVSGANQGFIISANAVDPQPTATEVLRVAGGAIIEGASADSTVIGRGASGNTNTVAIGRLASAGSSTNVAIGNSATANATTSVAVGGSASAGNNNTVAIGASSSASQSGATAVGQSAAATGTNAIAIGLQAAASGTGAICIGRGTANAVGAIVLTGGAATANAFRVIIVAGGSMTARDNEQIWLHAGGATPSNAGSTGGMIFIGGTNGAALSVTHANCIVIGMNQGTFGANHAIIGGAGTPITTVCIGRGDTSTAAVAGGLTIRCTNGSGTDIDMGPLTVIAPRSTGNVTTGKIIFQTGAPGATGAVLQAATTQFEILPSAGGAGVAGVNFANVTTGAAAAVGTLNNAPAAGNPTFWIPVQVNGVVKYIPAW